jgi:hypothetical protein
MHRSARSRDAMRCDAMRRSGPRPHCTSSVARMTSGTSRQKSRMQKICSSDRAAATARCRRSVRGA